MYTKIIGTGSYLPEQVRTNADLEKMVETSDEWIVTRTGIRERRIAAAHETVATMGFEAAKPGAGDGGRVRGANWSDYRCDHLRHARVSEFCMPDPVNAGR